MALQTTYEFSKFNIYLKHSWMFSVTLINLSEFSCKVDNEL